MMFTQAGFRDDFKVLGFGDVSKKGTGGIAHCALARWPTGEVAWVSRTQICWPHQVIVYTATPELIATAKEAE